MSQKNPAPQFICKRRTYSNNLPIAQLACPPKFMNLSFQNIERYGKCGITKLEEEYRYEVWPEDILRHCPPLVDLNIFKKKEGDVLNEKDALLLEDDFTVQTNTKRSQQHAKIVPFMRKTEYISAEFNRYGVSNDRSEAKVGYSIKKKMGNQDNLYKDQASQVAAIKAIFEETNKPVKKHYSKPGVHAVEEIMLLPDEDQWKFSYAQVIFDSDPLPSSKNSQQLQERVIAKGMKDQEGNNFVAYFVPTEETLQQKLTEEAEGIPYTPGHEYKYTCGREYNWTVQTKQSHGPDVEAYFFTQRDGAMYYCEVDTRVKLNRRAKPSNTSRNSMLLLTHREHTEDELKAMERRKNKLYDPYVTGEFVPLPEEEEEEEEEAESGEEEQPSDKEGEEEGAEATPVAPASAQSSDDEKSKSESGSESDSGESSASSNSS